MLEERTRITRLRSWLRVNAALSTVSGLVALVAANPIDRTVGLERPVVVRIVGIALVVYAVDLLLLAAARGSRMMRLVPWVVAADIGWVAATAAVLISGSVDGSGAWLLGSLALPVAGVGLGQHRALRSLAVSR